MPSYSWTLPSSSSSGSSGSPSGGSSGSLPSTDNSAGALQQREFGTDIYFQNDFEITSAGDYLLLSGLENLKAAIYRRLLTNPGEYKFVPEYGVGMKLWVKKPNNSSNRDRLRTAIRDNLLRDPRIEEVVQVAIETLDNEVGLRVGLVVRANGRALRFRPFNFTETT